MADPGEGAGGGRVPLFLNQTRNPWPNWGAKGWKKNWRSGSPLISGSGWPGPPYLKIRIRHWFVPLERSLSSLGLGANRFIRELSWKEWALGWFNSVRRGPYLVTLDRFVVVDKHIVHLNFSLSKRDIFSLLKESSVLKHFVILYCLFTNALFNFEFNVCLTFFSVILTPPIVVSLTVSLTEKTKV